MMELVDIADLKSAGHCAHGGSSPLLATTCSMVLDDKEDVSDVEELTRGLMALLANFSGKYYCRRILERRKKNVDSKR